MLMASGAMVLTADYDQSMMFNVGVKGGAKLHEAQFENSEKGERSVEGTG